MRRISQIYKNLGEASDLPEEQKSTLVEVCAKFILLLCKLSNQEFLEIEKETKIIGGLAHFYCEHGSKSSCKQLLAQISRSKLTLLLQLPSWLPLFSLLTLKFNSNEENDSLHKLRSVIISRFKDLLKKEEGRNLLSRIITPKYNQFNQKLSKIVINQFCKTNCRLPYSKTLECLEGELLIYVIVLAAARIEDKLDILKCIVRSFGIKKWSISQIIVQKDSSEAFGYLLQYCDILIDNFSWKSDEEDR